MEQNDKVRRQAAFDKVWRHFVAEGGRPSIDDRGCCVYRGPFGARCAFGVLLPDNVLADLPQTCRASYLDREDFEASGLIKTEDGQVARGFADVLQSAHDTWAEMVTPEAQHTSPGIRANLLWVAGLFDLSVPS
jgi:hypothetical protein